MSDNKQLPWVGVALIVTSLFLPYVSVMGIMEFSGLEMIQTIGSLMNEMGLGDEIAEETGGVGLSGEEVALGIAVLMLIFSPFIFALSGLISAILLMANKSPRIIGGFHLAFVLMFVLCAALAPNALEVVSIFDFIGTGFGLGAFSSVLLFMRTPDPYN